MTQAIRRIFPHWGPPAWRRLEGTARAGELTEAFMEMFTASLPDGNCGCRGHWKAILEAYPPPYGASAADQWRWAWSRHNDVSRRLGKPEMSMEEAEKLYLGLAAAPVLEVREDLPPIIPASAKQQAIMAKAKDGPPVTFEEAKAQVDAHLAAARAAVKTP